MQMIKTIGLDIAKSVFQVHGVDADGGVVVRRQLLAICRMIIEQHGGQLSASPAHPCGSVFQVDLPAGRPGVA
jgi:hypothetical protein